MPGLSLTQYANADAPVRYVRFLLLAFMQDFRAIWIIFAEILMKRLLSFIFVSAVLASCLGTEYYDVASEKLSADDPEIPLQESPIP